MIVVSLKKNNNWLKENGYSKEQEADVYDSQLQDVIDNPRWYLDNLTYLKEYRVSWKNYSSKGTKTATIPLKLVNKQKPL